MLGIHDASIAWISVVVGVHFFGFYVIWRLPVMVWIGAAISVCGALGLLAAGMDRSAALIAVVAGIVPGAVLLAGGWWSRFHPTSRPGSHPWLSSRLGSGRRSCRSARPRDARRCRMAVGDQRTERPRGARQQQQASRRCRA